MSRETVRYSGYADGLVYSPQYWYCEMAEHASVKAIRTVVSGEIRSGASSSTVVFYCFANSWP